MIYSSNFLPCLAYMSSILKENEIFININEQYQKQSYHTRANIISPNKVEFINVNVKKSPNHTVIKDIKIDYAFTDIGDASVALHSHIFSLRFSLSDPKLKTATSSME